MSAAGQCQFDFNSDRGRGGYEKWQEQRRLAMRQLAAKLGLPLERKVEVWLRGDIRLIGTLRLREETLFVPENRDLRIELIVDGVPFTPDELISCVRMD